MACRPDARILRRIVLSGLALTLAAGAGAAGGDPVRLLVDGARERYRAGDHFASLQLAS